MHRVGVFLLVLISFIGSQFHVRLASNVKADFAVEIPLDAETEKSETEKEEQSSKNEGSKLAEGILKAPAQVFFNVLIWSHGHRQDHALSSGDPTLIHRPPERFV